MQSLKLYRQELLIVAFVLVYIGGLYGPLLFKSSALLFVSGLIRNLILGFSDGN